MTRKISSLSEWDKDKFFVIFTEEGLFEVSYAEYFDTMYWHHQAHRIDGPAIMSHNTEFWIIKGKIHRTDGPAISTAGLWQHYYLDNEEHSKKDFTTIVGEAKRLPPELKLTDPRWWVREMK
jgi:hypothetical protein